jgi:anti-sigma B factor antagonist
VELLHVRRADRGGWTVVEVEGQIDAATAPQLRQALVEAQYGASTRLLLDLDGVEFLDSMGLGVIVGAVKRARSHDGELVLVCTRDRLLHLLELTGLTQVLQVAASQSDVIEGEATG